MQQEESGGSDPIAPLALRKITPLEADAASDRLRWVGLDAARYRAAQPSGLFAPALTHHWLVLFARPPEKLDLLYEGVKRHGPPAAGTVSLVPAGTPVQWRWRGHKDSFHIHLEPGLVARVAAQAFEPRPSAADATAARRR